MKNLRDLFNATNSMLISSELLEKFPEFDIYRFGEDDDDIYQWILTDDVGWWEYYTDYPIFEIEDTREYLIGITHLGVSWNQVPLKEVR